MLGKLGLGKAKLVTESTILSLPHFENLCLEKFPAISQVGRGISV